MHRELNYINLIEEVSSFLESECAKNHSSYELLWEDFTKIVGTSDINSIISIIKTSFKDKILLSIDLNNTAEIITEFNFVKSHPYKIDVYRYNEEPIEAFEEYKINLVIEGAQHSFFRSWRDYEDFMSGGSFYNTLFCYI